MQSHHTKHTIIILVLIVLAVVIFTTYSKSSVFDTPGTSSRPTGSVVDVTFCTPNPASLKLQAGQTATFKNLDEVGHTIFFNPKVKFMVPAEGMISVSLAELPGAGIWKYQCDWKPAGEINILRSN